MAAFDTTRTFEARRSFGGWVFAFVAGIIDTIVVWNDRRMTRKALSRLTDRELDDIGLVRGDLDDM
ncbi:MAG: DUF1127 domain-containing protein [Pseudomonadota bacterium]